MEALRERAAGRLARLRRGVPNVDLELYVREADTLRVTVGRGATTSVREGRDRGWCLRGIDDQGRTILLRSSTDDDDRVLVGAGSFTRNRSMRPPARRPWATHGRPLRDLDAPLEPPTPAALRDRLERSIDRPGSSSDGWIEVAATREVWVGDGGLDAVRARYRGWAVVHPGDASRPRLVASRRWSGLPDAGLFGQPGTDAAPPPSPSAVGRQTVLLSPAAAATVLDGVARIWEPERFPAGASVGPGWRLRDDPTEPGALFGGAFDDAGFSTGPVVLADGERVTDHLPATGFLRRGAFRDRPASRPCHPILEPPSLSPPQDCLAIDELGIQPLGPREWLLLGTNRSAYEDGTPSAARVVLRVDPVELVRGCLGGIGEPVASHRGGRCPALLFEGVERLPDERVLTG